MKQLDSIQKKEKCIFQMNSYLFCGNYVSIKFIDDKSGDVKIITENRKQSIFDNENMNDESSVLIKREYETNNTQI